MSVAILPFLTGLLLAASFPRANQGWLAWVAWVPLIVFISLSRNRRSAFCSAFLAFALEYFTLLRWIPEVLGRYGGVSPVLAWILYSLLICLLACYPAAACAATKHLMLRGAKGMLLFFPAVWILMEFTQSLSPLGGLPWLLAGYTQSRFLPVLQIADITGVYGVSFLVLCVNTAIAWLLILKGKGRSAYAPIAAAILLVAGCLIYGQASLKHWTRTGANYQTAMLQGNLSIEDSMGVLEEKFQQGYVRMAESLPHTKVDLLILPESPAPTIFQSDAGYRRAMEQLARGFPLGLVFSNVRLEQAGGEMQYYNSAFFLDRAGALAGSYDKIHLVPFGEYIPLKNLFSFAETISKDIGEFRAGTNYQVVKIGRHPANAIICFEAVFPALVRRFVNNGSQLILNLTNDGWYGISAAPYQHLEISRLRAIENRRYLLRATNSGISAIIEPNGRIQSSTGLMQEAVCSGRFDFFAEKTFYTRYGDVFVLLCAIICAVATFGVRQLCCRLWMQACARRQQSCRTPKASQ